MAYSSRNRDFLEAIPSKKISGAANLKKILDKGISEYSEIPCLEKTEERMRFPVGVGVMMDYITSLTTHWKSKKTSKPLPTTDLFQEAYKNYRNFFSKNKIEFGFPPEIDDGGNPNPNYHALEGQSIMYVDWKLSHPHVSLQCFHCKYKKKFEKNSNFFFRNQ